MRNFCIVATGIALAVGVGAPRQALAWGNDGHRIVGDIAWHFLKPKTKAAVRDYLADPNYATLADAATWPDTFARRFKKYDGMKPLHFVDIAPQATSYQANRDCAHGCVVTALDKYIGILSSTDDDSATSWRNHQQALYWVSHFVGDIHQPLHVAHPDMHGGNSTQVLFFGQPEKAHWVWDTGLISKLELPFKTPADRDEDAEEETLWQDLSYSLWSEISPAQVTAWQATPSPINWANETFAVAKQQAFLKSNETVDASYVASRTAALRQQLQKAGVRLAGVLNRALGQ
jgi:hypothetical protein